MTKQEMSSAAGTKQPVKKTAYKKPALTEYGRMRDLTLQRSGGFRSRRGGGDD